MYSRFVEDWKSFLIYRICGDYKEMDSIVSFNPKIFNITHTKLYDSNFFFCILSTNQKIDTSTKQID